MQLHKISKIHPSTHSHAIDMYLSPCFLSRFSGLDRPNHTASDPHRGSVQHSNMAVLTTSPTRLIEVGRTWLPKQPLGKGPVLHCVLLINSQTVHLCLQVVASPLDQINLLVPQ